MNIALLRRKGSKYINAAVNNWDRRRARLISAFIRSFETPDLTKKLRIEQTINELDERIRLCLEIKDDHKKAMQKQTREYDDTMMFLKCYSSECSSKPNSVEIGVMMKDYTPEAIKCDVCGKPLEPKGTQHLKVTLAELGIQFRT